MTRMIPVPPPPLETSVAPEPAMPDPYSAGAAELTLASLKIKYQQVVRSEPDSILYINHHTEARTLWVDRSPVTGKVTWHQVAFGFAVHRPAHAEIETEA